MNSADVLRGVLPSAVTPFDDDGRVDLAVFERHVARMVAARVGGVIVASTLGEAGSLAVAEKLALVRCAAAVAGPAGVPVVAAVVGCGLAQDAPFVSQLREHGATAMLLFPPVLYRPNADELVAHVSQAIALGGLPTVVFNKPATFGCDFSPRLAERLAGEPRWIGIKEAAELTARIPEWKRAFGERCRVFAGDELSFEALALGADGFVAGLGNAVPAECVAMADAFAQGRVDDALRWYRWLAPLFDLDVSPLLVQNIKLATAAFDRFPEAVRPPRLALAGAERARVAAVVADALRSRPSAS